MGAEIDQELHPQHRSDKDRDGSRTRSRRKENGTGRKTKASLASFDVIDRLDISGLYGGGGLMRHEGPFAAADASRNQGPHAPLGAFKRTGVSGDSSGRPPGSSALSPRAAATLAAMNDQPGLGNSPYSAATPNSESQTSISMGFPSAEAGKGQQLIEMYGVREREAWEDFGYSGNAARSNQISKDDRAVRTQSIWDIEATLEAGKPVGAPPPMPALPDEYSNKPKRSKSLAARFRPRKSEDNPDGYEPQQQQQLFEPQGHSPSYGNSETEEVVERQWPSSPRRANHESGGSDLARRPSVMQRLFGKKTKA